MKRRIVALLLALSCIFTLAACNGNQESGSASGSGSSQLLTIGTATTGGGWFPMGGALASVLTKYMPNTTVTAIATNASLENLTSLEGKNLELGMANSDVVYQRLKGINGYDPFQEELATLFMMDEIYVTVVVPTNSPYKTFKDLKGKKVGTGTAGSGFYFMVEAILESYGWTYDDIIPYQASNGDQADALKDGNIDAYCVLTPGKYGPSAGFVELMTTFDCRLLPFDEEQLTELPKEKPFYNGSEIPAGWYEGLEEAVPTFSVNTQLCVRADMDEELAYEITKTVFEHVDELAEVHPNWGGLTLDLGCTNMILPAHPGAQRYYEEQGKTVTYLE